MTYKPPYTIPKIMKMQAEGQTQSQIARHFGMSRARVGQIIQRERQRLASTEQAQRLHQQIRANSNDLDRNLPLGPNLPPSHQCTGASTFVAMPADVSDLDPPRVA